MRGQNRKEEWSDDKGGGLTEMNTNGVSKIVQDSYCQNAGSKYSPFHI
jgi:hypothetical protein